MKKQRILIIISIFIFFNICCSRYSVRTEINKSSEISKIKKAGIILRVSTKSKIALKEHLDSIYNWLGGYKQIKDIYIVEDVSDEKNYFNNDNVRFYQTSLNGNFLKYKSVGIITHYLRRNSSELKRIVLEHNLDGLIIYEIFSIISSEMQFMDFDSVILITDKNLNILYMDNQNDSFESLEIDSVNVNEQLLDRISGRFLEKLIDIDFIEELDI